MPSPVINEFFQHRFGYSLNEVAGNPELVDRLRVVNGEHPREISMQQENFHRGLVIADRFVSAQSADTETMMMLKR